jgi:cation transport regulator
MPSAANTDLPFSVRLHLPAHALDIFRTAFNHAFKQYIADPRLEEIANRIAWSAVKRSYEKYEGKWVPRSRAK